MRPRAISAWLLLAFPLLILGVFALAPAAFGLGVSLFDWDGAGRPTFVGVRNFVALAHDPGFVPALRNTLVFAALTVPPSVMLGFLLAAALHARWFVGRGWARTMLFMPTVVSIIAVGFVWRWLLDERGGLVPAALRAIGVESPNFLEGGAVFEWAPFLHWPMLSIAVVQVWRTVGFCAVLYGAALAVINESVGEAAEIDGARRWQVLAHVTWPQVAPTTAFLVITGMIGAFQVFDVVWAMTNGTESAATTVLNLSLFREFQRSRLGYASAIGAVVLVLSAVVTLAQVRFWRREG